MSSSRDGCMQKDEVGLRVVSCLSISDMYTAVSVWITATICRLDGGLATRLWIPSDETSKHPPSIRLDKLSCVPFSCTISTCMFLCKARPTIDYYLLFFS